MSRLLVVASFSIALQAQSLNGLWDASVEDNGLVVPFRIELSGQGTKVKGSIVNGDDRVTSTTGKFENGSLVLNFDHYAGRLEAGLSDGTLRGKYIRPKTTYAFEAKRFVPSKLTQADVPSIAGLWDVQVKSPKGESAWHFIVKQAGAEVAATILRVDGDTGALEGTYRDGKFRLSHFAGTSPLLIEVTPGKDGTLTLTRNGTETWTAIRSSVARAQGLPEPTDPSRHTSVKDPTEPFRFSFKDLDGSVVSNDDPKFHDRVVIVAISGSWCPNCHDEAPFLMELYRKYHGRGLEIVSLSFEEPEQQKDLTRLRAFVKQYGIKFPILIPGEPSELQAKLPQTVNLNAWPTTFYLGRDGLVRSVHAGFAGPASGEFHEEQKHEITALVEKLLAENVVSKSVSRVQR
jgi:thiol-disulfide isomerase/thioredoxin